LKDANKNKKSFMYVVVAMFSLLSFMNNLCFYMEFYTAFNIYLMCGIPCQMYLTEEIYLCLTYIYICGIFFMASICESIWGGDAKIVQIRVTEYWLAGYCRLRRQMIWGEVVG